VDCLKIVPSHLRALRTGQADALPRRRLILGGEPLSWAEADELQALAPGCTVFNHYGPTESTVGVLTSRVDQGAWRGATVPLGRPLANVRTLVLDAAGRPVPIGGAGELLLGGAGLARGYLGRPDLTAERFVPDPSASDREPGARLYRTGDLVRHLSDGSLQFLGRVDHQVKVRGFRVELGEVEAALAADPTIHEAAVVVQGEGDDRHLAAYVVPAAGAAVLEVAELRRSLRDRLPEHMVPAAWAVLPALPLNANGKVDRRALPVLARDGMKTAAAAPPRDELELQLVQIWEDLLDVRPVGIHDRFFDLGGHSLLAVRLAARIEQRLGRRPALADLLERPTVAELAELLRAGDAHSPRPVLVPLQPRGGRPPLFCVHPIGGSVLCYLDLCRELGADQPVYGLQSVPPEASGDTVEEMAAAYLVEIARLQPAGPYLFAGWSFGGLVAYEMACRLEKVGGPAAQVAMIDVGPPGPRAGEDAGDPAADLALFAVDLLGVHPGGEAIDPERFRALARTLPVDELLALPEVLAALPPDLGPRQVGELYATFRRNLRAARAYRPRPYGGPLALVRSEATVSAGSAGAGSEGPDQTEAGWAALAGGGLTVEVLPGNHYSLLRPPHATALGHWLRRRLLKTDTSFLVSVSHDLG
jgi:thioesterase domain-containing protein/acyl carrier protein